MQNTYDTTSTYERSGLVLWFKCAVKIWTGIFQMPSRTPETTLNNIYMIFLFLLVSTYFT